MIGSAFNAKITEEQVLRAIVKREARTTPFEKKKGPFFVNFHCIYANTLILVNMQYLQYVYYYSLLFKTLGMCEGASKQNYTAPPPFEIPGSAPDSHPSKG